jgi:hypothetical protein
MGRLRLGVQGVCGRIILLVGHKEIEKDVVL